MSKKSWRDTYSGGYLKSGDLPREGQRVKLLSIEEKIIRNGEKPKLVADLKGQDQQWVLNATNCELLSEILGSDDPDEWCGTTIELFNDHSVRGPNGEKGGIRVREASSPSKKRAKRTKDEEADDDEDLDDFDDED